MKIVTLNIQGGFKIEQLCQEIKEKLVPFDLLCLQEVCEGRGIKNHAQQIADFLDQNYKAVSFLPIDFKIKKMGNGFVFRPKEFGFLNSHDFTLPSPALNWFWKPLNNRFCLSCLRLCQTGLFQTGQRLKIRVANLHLDFVGGSQTRQKQVKFVLKTLSGLEKVDLEFILGDFNTLCFLKKKLPELALIRKKGFQEVSQNISWTASPSNPDPNWKQTYWLMRFSKPFHFLLRKKADYIFVKGKLKETKCFTLDFASSDHRALVFEFKT